MLPTLPVVWGLRLFPRAGGAEEIALGQALAGTPAAGRAAFVLRRVDGLADAVVEALLRAADVPDPESALRSANRLDESAGAAARALLTSRSSTPARCRPAPPICCAADA
ncbi:hypothetical protein [Streptomyces sp. LN325]|uniref:hypothetical protein n=1 Tax=Streptomyces sp. LN325 TaxID=3112976 RepID=UPI0037108E57